MVFGNNEFDMKTNEFIQDQLAILLHNIKTPVNAINGLAQMLASNNYPWQSGVTFSG